MQHIKKKTQKYVGMIILYFFLWTVANWVPLWDVLPLQYLVDDSPFAKAKTSFNHKSINHIDIDHRIQMSYGQRVFLFSFSLPLQTTMIHA